MATYSITAAGGSELVQCASATGLSTAAPGTWTIHFWHKTATYVSLAQVFGYGAGPGLNGASGANRYTLQFDNDYYFWGNNADKDTGVAWDTGSSWYMIDWVSDGTNLILYRNGVNVYEDLITGIALTTAGTYISAFGSDGGDTFDGKLCDLAIWSTNLSSTQIANLYSQADRPNNYPTDLACYWALTEGSGTTLNDSSGNGNTGTASGGVGWSTDTPFGSPGFALEDEPPVVGLQQTTAWASFAWTEDSDGIRLHGALEEDGPLLPLLTQGTWRSFSHAIDDEGATLKNFALDDEPQGLYPLPWTPWQQVNTVDQEFSPSPIRVDDEAGLLALRTTVVWTPVAFSDDADGVMLKRFALEQEDGFPAPLTALSWTALAWTDDESLWFAPTAIVLPVYIWTPPAKQLSWCPASKALGWNPQRNALMADTAVTKDPADDLPYTMNFGRQPELVVGNCTITGCTAVAAPIGSDTGTLSTGPCTVNGPLCTTVLSGGSDQQNYGVRFIAALVDPNANNYTRVLGGLVYVRAEAEYD